MYYMNSGRVVVRGESLDVDTFFMVIDLLRGEVR